MSVKLKEGLWLFRHGYGPNVYCFRNLESGQVVYSQLPTFTNDHLNQQFERPNWENRKPKTRKDVWRIMAVSHFETYELAVEAYNSLIELRRRRIHSQRDLVESWRKRDEFGHIWYSAQYRPTYTQEAVADLSSVANGLECYVKIWWENEWRRGNEKYWNRERIEHAVIPKMDVKQQYQMLKRLADESRREYWLSKFREAARERDEYAKLRAEYPELPERKFSVHPMSRLQKALLPKYEKRIRKVIGEERGKEGESGAEVGR